MKEDRQEIDFPQILFAVKWMCENIRTDTIAIDADDPVMMKELADECRVSYLKNT